MDTRALWLLAAFFFLGGVPQYYLRPGHRKYWLWLSITSSFLAGVLFVFAGGGDWVFAIALGTGYAAFNAVSAATARKYADRARRRLGHTAHEERDRQV